MYNKPERERGGVLMKMKPIGDLVQQLSHSKLELRQLLLLCHVGIVDGVLPNLKKKDFSDNCKDHNRVGDDDHDTAAAWSLATI